jgi:arginine decarboxylase
VLPVANAQAYNRLWQFKADAWSSLEDAAVQLSVASAGERSLERAADRAVGTAARLQRLPPSFFGSPGLLTPEGDVRRAFYLSYNDTYCEYLMPEEWRSPL